MDLSQLHKGGELESSGMRPHTSTAIIIRWMPQDIIAHEYLCS